MRINALSRTMTPDQRRMMAVEGYETIGLPTDALDELEQIQPEIKAWPELIAWKVKLLIEVCRYAEALEIGEGAIASHPHEWSLYIPTAYAARQVRGVASAKLILLSGESAIEKTKAFPAFLWLLTEVECALGNVADARRRLTQVLAINPEVREKALENETMRPLWATLQS